MSRRPFEPTNTTITFAPGGVPFVLAFVTITPPAWDGGDPIDTVILNTNKFKTKMAPTLIDIGNMSFTAEYNGATCANAPINRNGLIKVTIPGEGEWQVYGYLKSITPDEMKAGDRAMCSGEFVITNTGDDGYTEIAPVWVDDVNVVPTFATGSYTLAQLKVLWAAATNQTWTNETASKMQADLAAVAAGTYGT